MIQNHLYGLAFKLHRANQEHRTLGCSKCQLTLNQNQMIGCSSCHIICCDNHWLLGLGNPNEKCDHNKGGDGYRIKYCQDCHLYIILRAPDDPNHYGCKEGNGQQNMNQGP